MKVFFFFFFSILSLFVRRSSINQQHQGTCCWLIKSIKYENFFSFWRRRRTKINWQKGNKTHLLEKKILWKCHMYYNEMRVFFSLLFLIWKYTMKQVRTKWWWLINIFRWANKCAIFDGKLITFFNGKKKIFFFHKIGDIFHIKASFSCGQKWPLI